MSKAQFKLPPLTVWHSTFIAAAAIYIVYMASKAFARMDSTANAITAPAGSLISDVTAWANGNHRIEFTPLVIQPHYLNANYVISDQAWEVLTRNPQYKQLMYGLFDNRVLKPQYRHLVGQQITGL
ncbi:hypothetical protein EXU30_00095 [Shewanella maritima]|uniref:Uncharacterized protein n=1 Tax=Shewanella maritima TaxID=2520507 RepID=A0A411PCJ8_9GAMM|nr:hypothetical protein [Shewanella maritima]QBF81269.1 hypothetical protein EXU30_00095 [Shewanella maritima]